MRLGDFVLSRRMLQSLYDDGVHCLKDIDRYLKGRDEITLREIMYATLNDPEWEKDYKIPSIHAVVPLERFLTTLGFDKDSCYCKVPQCLIDIPQINMYQRQWVIAKMEIQWYMITPKTSEVE